MDESCFGEMMSRAGCQHAAQTAVSPLSPHDPQVAGGLAFTGVDSGALVVIALVLALLGTALLTMAAKVRRAR